VPVEGIEPPT